MIPLGFGENLIIGVISGIVASIFFTVILLLVRPKIKVSDKICCDDNHVYRIKVVNKTCFMLTNIKYKLYYCRIHGDGITTMEEIQPRKSSPIIHVNKYSIFDKDANYAFRISYNIDFEKYPIDRNTKFEFVLIADHSLSNTTKCVNKDYCGEDIIKGVFESGQSTKIIRKI